MCIVVGLYEGKEFGKVLARSRRSVCHKIFLRFQKKGEINFKIIKKNEAHNLIRILHLIKRFYLKWVLIQLLLLKAMTLSTDLPGFQGSLRYKHVERNIGTMMFS